MADRESLRRLVKQWRQAGEALEEIRRREIENLDTRQAILQIFGTAGWPDQGPPRTTSGLVEQQAWFARLRLRNRLP